MNVPETNATPRTIERAVRTSLSLCPNTLRVAALNMSSSPTLSVETLHPLEHHVGRRPGHLVDDLAVGEEQHPVGVRRTAGVVGHDDDRLPEVVHGLPQEVQHLDAGP